MIKISKELSGLLDEISAKCADACEDNSYSEWAKQKAVATFDEDVDYSSDFSREVGLVNMGFDLSQKYKNNTIYAAVDEWAVCLYFFVGDLNKELIPMFNKELAKWEKKVAEVNEQYEVDAARELDEEIKLAEERVKALKKQKASKRK